MYTINSFKNSKLMLRITAETSSGQDDYNC